MSDLIDRDALREAMYHRAFETDDGMQNWNSGLWVRYKAFEQEIEKVPTVDAVEVVRCKDCKYDHTCTHEMIRRLKGGSLLYCPVEYCSEGERKEE